MRGPRTTDPNSAQATQNLSVGVRTPHAAAPRITAARGVPSLNGARFGFGCQYPQGRGCEYETVSCDRMLQASQESLVTQSVRLVAVSLCLTILHLSLTA